MLASLHMRAESLAWAVESMARLDHARDSFSQALAEFCRQPGIAWIALVAPSGRIIADSNAELEGSLLYTPAELAELELSPALQGRFIPDYPQIFETWKLFRPGRLGHGRHGKRTGADNVIFVALDAGGMLKALQIYKDHLWLISWLLILFVASTAALLLVIRYYRISRRGLKDARAFSEQVIKSYPSPMLATDNSGRIIFANDPAAAIFGKIGGQIQPPQGLNWKEILNTLKPGKPVIAREFYLALPNGGSASTSLSAAVIMDSENRQTGYLFSFSDIEEIKKLQRKLSETERIAAIGNLAAGIAHEIRNPLSSICGYANFLKTRLANEPMYQTTAALLEEEATRLNSALCDLLNLVKKPKLKKGCHNLAEILAKAKALVKSDADAKNINLEIECRLPMEFKIYCDRDKLLQALLNLLLNAIQAAPENGEVRLCAKLPEKDDIPAELSGAKDMLKIAVRDNGHGIDETVLKKMFSPYFTTRAEGTGLGLTLTKQIIDAHGGIVTAASQVDSGAEFAIFLPACLQ